jgi:predicted metal-dependent enzyme (double-stranded beta helix superfamily)
MSMATILRPVPTAAPPLSDIALGLARCERLWRAVVRHRRDDRHAVRLLATPAYEAWVIGWWPGQSVPLHDHGGAEGVLVVTEGVLGERRLEQGRLVPHLLTPHRLVDLPVGLVHTVVNPGLEPATSIHVYAPHLSEMGHYDPESGRRIHTEAIISEPPALPSAAGGVLLHPSA